MPRFGSQFRALPSQARENYVHPESRKHRTLRYYVRGGKHIVAVDYPYLERPHPEVKTFAMVEEARQEWRVARERMAAEGYVEEKL